MSFPIGPQDLLCPEMDDAEEQSKASLRTKCNLLDSTQNFLINFLIKLSTGLAVKDMRLFIFKMFTLFLVFPIWGESPEEMLQEAHASYQQGEKATTYQERKLAFNRALFLYSTLEQKIDSRSADLDQALADTYFQLGEYAWAILYYQRALKKNSLNVLLLSHLEQAQEKLDLSPSVTHKNEIEPFFFLSKQFQLIFLTILITFLTFSCAIWFPFPVIRTLAIGCALLLFLLLGNMFFFYYFVPLEGILIKTTGFYRAPDRNEPQLTNQPLLAGSKVQILQMTKDGDWLKIEDSTGTIGYIPTASLRPV